MTTAAQHLHRLVIAAFGLLALMTALTSSALPSVLGFYSKGWFAYQLLNVAGLACLLAPLGRVGIVGRQVAYVLVIVSTFIAPTNEAVRAWLGLQAILPGLRLLAAVAIVAAEFDRFRAGRRTRAGVLGLGVTLAILSVFDLGLWIWVVARTGLEEDYSGYRDRYDLRAITPSDIVLVGDSFVWGHGVRKAERFGDVLERLYAREGRHVRVYSLGLRGAGPEEELDALARIPPDRRAGAVVLAFYPNDLPPRPRPHSRLLGLAQGLTWPLARSSLTFRALHDLLGKVETPSVAQYHRSVVADYRRGDPTFLDRWLQLMTALARFAALARQRAEGPPVLIILPLMVDYGSYPLERVHADLAREAQRLGYDVLDLLPVFRSELGNGDRYRVTRQDNHFDARVHALVARVLKPHLDARRARPSRED